MASSILSIMANASLFEKLMGLAHTLIAHYADQIVSARDASGLVLSEVIFGQSVLGGFLILRVALCVSMVSVIRFERIRKQQL